MAKINSGTSFLFKTIKFFLFLPYTLFRILSGKAPLSDLNFFKEIYDFFFEAQVTAWLIISNIFIYFLINILSIVNFISDSFIEHYFISNPFDILSFNFFSLFGAMFFHANLLHLFGNMLVLFVMGRIVEKHFGFKKMLFFYIFSGLISHVATSIVYIFMGVNVGGLGASGAISGMAAVAMLVAPFSLTYMAGIPLPVILVSWGYIASDVLGILNPVPGDNVGHIAHVAGFFSVTLIAFFLSKEDKNKLQKGLLLNIGVLIFSFLSWIFLKSKGLI